MKKYGLLVAVLASLLVSPATLARQPIIGVDIIGLTNDETNFYYQSGAFSNSAFRVGGASDAAGNLSLDLGFRFYFGAYANSPYVQGDVLFANGTTTRAQIGMDIPFGNLIVDPNFWSGGGSSGVGLNLGLRL